MELGWEKLLKIEYYDNSGALSWCENFNYDKNRLVRVEVPIYNEYTEYEYDGRQLSKACQYCDNVLYSTCDFTYSGGKISKIEVTSNSSKGNRQSRISPLRFIFPEEVVEQINIYLKKQNALCKSDSKQSITFEWDGKNVSKVKIMDSSTDEPELEYAYSYDTKNNPYWRFMDENPTDVRSRNNIVKLKITNSSGSGITYLYTYEYDGKFPVKKTGKAEGSESSSVIFLEYE